MTTFKILLALTGIAVANLVIEHVSTWTFLAPMMVGALIAAATIVTFTLFEESPDR